MKVKTSRSPGALMVPVITLVIVVWATEDARDATARPMRARGRRCCSVENALARRMECFTIFI